MRPEVKPALRMNSAATAAESTLVQERVTNIGNPDWKNFQTPGFVAGSDVERAFRSAREIAHNGQITTGTNGVSVSEEKVAVTAKQVLHVVFSERRVRDRHRLRRATDRVLGYQKGAA
jgi:hypothetical protein